MQLLRLVSVMVVVTFWSTIDSYAKDYSVPLVIIEANVRVDGTVEYAEHRTYRFNGSFSEADYRLSRRGFDSIRDILVREGDHPYELARRGGEGTYRVATGRRFVEVLWRYAAQDEERTFTVSYVLDGAVVRGEEHAEFFWTFLSDRWETGTDSLAIHLSFEAGHPSEGIHIFLHGRSEDVDVVPTRHGLRISGAAFSSRDRLAARVVFPAAVVPSATVNDASFTLADVLEDEHGRVAREAEAAVARETRAARWSVLGMIIAFISVLTYAGIYRRYTDRPQLSPKVPVEVYQPPAARPPAVAGALILNGAVTSHSLVATLFDLCRRGYFKLVELEPVKVRFQPERVDYRIEGSGSLISGPELTSWERTLVSLVDQRRREGKETVREVFDFQKAPYQKWFAEWQLEVQRDVKAVNWYKPESVRGMYLNALSQLPLMALGVLTIVFAGAVGALPTITAAMLLIMSLAMRVRTDEGEREFRMWHAYRNVLRKGRLKDLSGALTIHFVYAVALHVSAKRLEALVSQGQPDDFSWLLMPDGVFISPVHLTKSVSMVTASVNTTVSTGVGVSAGVAGGGAGGGAR